MAQKTLYGHCPKLKNLELGDEAGGGLYPNDIIINNACDFLDKLCLKYPSYNETKPLALTA